MRRRRGRRQTDTGRKETQRNKEGKEKSKDTRLLALPPLGAALEGFGEGQPEDKWAEG